VSAIQPAQNEESSPEPARRQDTVAERRQPPATVTRKEKPTQKYLSSEIEQELKWSSYQQPVIEISTVLASDRTQ